MNASSDRLLRRTLWGNAVFSVISGAALVAFATPFARLATEAPLTVMGLDLALVFELLGLGSSPLAPSAPGPPPARPCRGPGRS
jgi:hypothetical protein